MSVGVFQTSALAENQNWVRGIASRLENMRERVDDQIRKNKQTIEKCEHLIWLAQQKGNLQVEEIRLEARTNALAAENKNLLVEKRLDKRIARKQNLLADFPADQNAVSVVNDFSGTVADRKKNGTV